MPASALMEYTGTLLRDAEVRARVIDHDGHSVPVLCVELEINNPARTHLHAEQRFDAAQHAQASLAAKRLTKGARITLQGQPDDMLALHPVEKLVFWGSVAIAFASFTALVVMLARQGGAA